MKKQWFVIFCIPVLCVALLLPTAAYTERLVDHADLLTDSEEATLSAKLDTVSETYGVDLVVVTTDSTDGLDPMVYADDYYDSHGYGEDGALLLISMEYRDWWISTAGSAIDAVDADTIGDCIVDDLSAGHYAAAIDTYIDECVYYIDGDVNGFPFKGFRNLLISLVIGVVVALIVTGVMRSKLKSVRRQTAAADYVRANSLQVTQANEFFLYRQVRRVKKSTSSGSHTASSGRSHGGGGGKF